jgi:hypothetical protein
LDGCVHQRFIHVCCQWPGDDIIKTRQAHLQKHSSQSNIGGHLGSQLLDRGGVLLCVHGTVLFILGEGENWQPQQL